MSSQSISDISIFLDRFDQCAFQNLRAHFPDDAAIFDHSGVTLGDAEIAPRQMAAWSMLESVGTVADQAQNDVAARLRAARWLERAGALLSLASSAGVIAALNLVWWKSGTLGFALLAFAGSAVPLVVNWLRSSGNVTSSVESLVRLRDLVWTGQTLQARLRRETLNDDDVDQANTLARDLIRVLDELGYRAYTRPV